MEKAVLWKIEKKRELEPADTHSATAPVFLSHAIVSAGTRMTKANYCCHFIKGIRLAGAGEATDWNVHKEIGLATTEGRFPLNSNICK